ncbi:MAG: hypothetical protein ABI824_15010 [Acidobacteriota bacterium]
MVETITTLVLTVGSGLLLCYWFRYTCLLVLSAKTTRDYAGEMARANGLSFLQVQAELRTASVGDLSKLHQALDRDYEIVSGLLTRCGDLNPEDRLLKFNYQVTRAFAKSVGSLSPTAARRALDEMAMVVAHFADTMGERAAMGAAA